MDAIGRAGGCEGAELETAEKADLLERLSILRLRLREMVELCLLCKSVGNDCNASWCFCFMMSTEGREVGCAEGGGAAVRANVISSILISQVFKMYLQRWSSELSLLNRTKSGWSRCMHRALSSVRIFAVSCILLIAAARQ